MTTYDEWKRRDQAGEEADIRYRLSPQCEQRQHYKCDGLVYNHHGDSEGECECDCHCEEPLIDPKEE